MRLKSLVWDTIISSGNLIKLDNKEIEIIQSVQQSVRLYNKDLDRLQKDVGLQLEETLEGVQIPNILNLPDTDILEEYLDNYKRIIDETVKQFKELDELS